MTIKYYVFEQAMEFEVDPSDFSGCADVEAIGEALTLAAREDFHDRMVVKVESLDESAAEILAHLNTEERDL